MPALTYTTSVSGTVCALKYGRSGVDIAVSDIISVDEATGEIAFYGLNEGGATLAFKEYTFIIGVKTPAP